MSTGEEVDRLDRGEGWGSRPANQNTGDCVRGVVADNEGSLFVVGVRSKCAFVIGGGLEIYTLHTLGTTMRYVVVGVAVLGQMGCHCWIG